MRHYLPIATLFLVGCLQAPATTNTAASEEEKNKTRLLGTWEMEEAGMDWLLNFDAAGVMTMTEKKSAVRVRATYKFIAKNEIEVEFPEDKNANVSTMGTRQIAFPDEQTLRVIRVSTGKVEDWRRVSR